MTPLSHIFIAVLLPFQDFLISSLIFPRSPECTEAAAETHTVPAVPGAQQLGDSPGQLLVRLPSTCHRSRNLRQPPARASCAVNSSVLSERCFSSSAVPYWPINLEMVISTDHWELSLETKGKWLLVQPSARPGRGVCLQSAGLDAQGSVCRPAVAESSPSATSAGLVPQVGSWSLTGTLRCVEVPTSCLRVDLCEDWRAKLFPVEELRGWMLALWTAA